MKHKVSVAQPCLTVCDPVDYTLPGSSVHGILQARYWSGLPFPPPGDFPDPGIEPTSLTSLALAGGFFTTSATREAPTPDRTEVGDPCFPQSVCFYP